MITWTHKIKRFRVADLEVRTLEGYRKYVRLGCVTGIRDPQDGHVIVFDGANADEYPEYVHVSLAHQEDGVPISPDEFARNLVIQAD